MKIAVSDNMKRCQVKPELSLDRLSKDSTKTVVALSDYHVKHVQ